MSQGPRTFVALPPPAATLEGFRSLGDACENRARARGIRPRRISPDSLHVTLKFLGATPSDRLESVAGVIGCVAAELRSERVCVAGWACFPRPPGARVIALGLDASTPGLARAARELDEGLKALGFAGDERIFRAHVTLARLARARDLRWLADEVALEPVVFELGRLVWFESVLGGSGARYRVLREWRLTGS